MSDFFVEGMMEGILDSDFDDDDFDWGDDADEVLECGLENPEICESCQ